MDAPKRRITENAERANPVRAVHFWQSPPGAAVDIVLIANLDVYSVIHENAIGSLPNETGGFLLGQVAYDAGRRLWHLEVNEAVPVEPLTQDPVHFTFSWRDVDRVRSYRETSQKALLGWYHTHPDLGIFLSETDLEKTHRVLFAEPFQVALVYDPVRHRAGYFFWEAPQIIDASEAPWREFEIAVGSNEPKAVPEPAVEPTAAVSSASGVEAIASTGARTESGPHE